VDPGNCGFCGITCAPAQACRGGLCQPAQTCRADLDCVRANEFCTARAVQDVGLTLNTHIDEARGMAPSSDGQRLFVTTRSPDGLLIVDISRDPATGLVRNRVVGFTLLPSGTDEVLAIPRPGKRDLVAVSCTTANAVAFYDDELGDATGLVEGIQEPFGLARTALAGNPNGARLFVASFGNDTVDVIDIVDLGRARTAALVGHMGFGAHRPLGINLPGTSP